MSASVFLCWWGWSTESETEKKKKKEIETEYIGKKGIIKDKSVSNRNWISEYINETTSSNY